MKQILTLTVLMTLLFSGLLLGETMDNLVEREGIYYKEFTDVPFTGRITGKEQGTIRNGKKDSPWIGYWDNGQLWFKGTYKDGKVEGPFVWYYDNGQLHYKGNFKDGEKEGPWVGYLGNGQLWWKVTFKDGKVEGDLVYYSPDGSVSE